MKTYLRLLIFLSLPSVVFSSPRPGYTDYQNISGPFVGKIDKIKKGDPSSLVSFIKAGGSRKIFLKALDFYEKNLHMFPNSEYISVVDLSRHSAEQRLFIHNMMTGHTYRYLVAHGKGGDKDHDGYVDKDGISNVAESKKSAMGAYLMAGEYFGNYDRSIRMIGLEYTNSNAFARDIVMHPAKYVSPESIEDNEQDTGKAVLGRSWGCPAVDFDHRDDILDMITGGSLLYIYADSYQADGSK